MEVITQLMKSLEDFTNDELFVDADDTIENMMPTIEESKESKESIKHPNDSNNLVNQSGDQISKRDEHVKTFFDASPMSGDYIFHNLKSRQGTQILMKNQTPEVAKPSKKDMADIESTYILPEEVGKHKQADDCWITILGWVYDLTPLIKKHENNPRFVRGLVPFGGRDLSHWFDKDSGNIESCIHPVTRQRVPFLPYEPCENNEKGNPWWKSNT